MRRLVLLSLLTLPFSTVFAHAAEQSRSTPAFKAIEIKGPINIVVEAGKPHAVTVQGDDKFVSRVVTEVVDGELKIYLRDKGPSSMSGESRILVAMPALGKFIAEGAGEARLTNISGDRLDVSYKGAGKLSAAGKVKWLRLKAQGVGEVDTKALIAEDVDVNFEGLGGVKVYASGKLNAVVRGMGELSYYGKPRTVNKSVAGVGSVKAAD